MKLYSGDLDRLGMLSSQNWRAARLVVDTGLHALGWTRQQAIDYMLAHTPQSVESAASEVDRYIILPGQATGYMLGRLEIVAAREEARAAAGSAFDIKAFHDRVLEDGAVPLTFLRTKLLHGEIGQTRQLNAQPVDLDREAGAQQPERTEDHQRQIRIVEHVGLSGVADARIEAETTFAPPPSAPIPCGCDRARPGCSPVTPRS
jgi:hypothetical protein